MTCMNSVVALRCQWESNLLLISHKQALKQAEKIYTVKPITGASIPRGSPRLLSLDNSLVEVILVIEGSAPLNQA